MVITLIRKLVRVRLLTPVGLFRLGEAIATEGINLMALLRLAAKLHPRRTAIAAEGESLSYPQLWQQACNLAIALQQDYGLQSGQKVAIACRNHPAAVKAIFAASRLGSHVFLFNPEMSAAQLQRLTKRLAVDFYIYDLPEDGAKPAWLQDSPLSEKSLPASHATTPCIDQLAVQSQRRNPRLRKVKTGNLVVMTGGTTGQPKAASRKPSLFTFLPPFIALLRQVELDRYRSVYIATPIYHGFGLAALLMGVLLGAELHLTRRFEAARACDLIAQGQIQVATLVPLMLQRMLDRDAAALISLRRILSGGARLRSTLAEAALNQLGPSLFNLYGTSEAGFCLLAAPELLRRKPASIGQPVWGVGAQIVGEANQPVSAGSIGRLRIRSAWSVSQNRWIETGDLAYRDADGDIFLCDRIDDMVVSGGENVYPIELENVLLQHPDIATTAVFGIPDEEFGQRLKAVVVRKDNAPLDEESLRTWLKPRVARYQMPAAIEFRRELPYTALGKLDKKALRS